MTIIGRIPFRALSILAAGALVSCGRDEPTGPAPGPSVDCAQAQTAALAPGETAIIDPAATGACLRLPAAGPAGAEYLVVVASTSTEVEDGGLTGPYQLTAGIGDLAAAAVAAAPQAPSPARSSSAAAFHLLLRDYERGLSHSPAVTLDRARLAPLKATPPAVGSTRMFEVLTSTTTPFTFTRVSATAKYVGRKVAIYLDDAAPADGYTQAEIDSAGALFDTKMYAVDSAAFGTESDIDGNGVVDVLLSPAINRLGGNCNVTGTVILGFFFGLDLLPSQPHSNAGEVFYSLVPDPTSSTCAISKRFAATYLAPTFIHEFQHMISFNQHVLVRGGSAEETWLNEGLSHFAEELGARLIPDDAGASPGTRFSQFAIGDVSNAYDYLSDPESNFLIEPAGSLGNLAERGANWLFVRWLIDHFDTDPTGRNLTRALLATSAVGQANVEAVTGETFPAMIVEWHLANYLDDLPGFTDPTGRLSYRSWNFRGTFSSLHDQDPSNFPSAYPLLPDTLLDGSYSHRGTLRGGSGRELLVVQGPADPAATVRLTADDEHPLASTLAARIGVVRIR